MSWEQEQWTIENCQPDLDLFTGDVLMFETGDGVKNVAVHRVDEGNDTSFIWGTWDYSTNGYLAQVTRTSGAYGIALTPEGKLTCSAVSGIFLSTAAALAGIPLVGGLLAAGVTLLGYVVSLYLKIVGEDNPNSETPGSSWTAQGGSQGGSGGATMTTSYSPEAVRA